MPLFLVPIIAGAAAYGAATQDEAGDYSAGEGERRIDAYQIWEQITTGPGAGSLAEGQSSASTLQRVYGQRVEQIEALNTLMDQAWQGDSADAAKAGAHPLKAWMQDSHTKLQDSDRYLGEQTSAFNTAHSKVQPVPKEPPESGFLNDITPWETDTDRAIKDYNTKAQANVDAFNEYFNASAANGRHLPTYTGLDGRIGDVDVEDGSGRDDGTGTPGDDGDRQGGGYPPGGGGIPGGGGVPGGGVPGGGYPGGAPGPGGSGPGGAYPPGSVPGLDGPGGYGGPGGSSGGYGSGGYGPGGVPGGGYTSPEWDDGTSVSGYTPPKVPSADFPGGGGGFGGGTPGGSGFGGGGSGSGAGGVGAAFGPGGVPGAGAGTPGSSTGAAPGGAAGAGRAGAMPGGAAAGGRGMAGGMPMGAMGGAGRGGKGGDDDERQSKFLIEEDGNSLFGTDELTAPPVIGE